MTEMVTTLLIGGRKDGELLEVRHHLDVIRTLGSLPSLASYVAGPLEQSGPPVETYRGKLLDFYGVPLLVHLHESLDYGKGTKSELTQALGEHLLSEKAKKVVLR